MIYSINGDAISAAYEYDGDSANAAFSIDGNQVFPDEDTLIVMTYNYQWCTKINSQLNMQNAIMSRYNPDIIGIQEAATNNKNSNSFPAIASQFLGEYTRQLSDQATNRNGIASKLQWSNYQCIKYTQNDDENWDYQKCYLTLPSGRVVVWYNTHLTWRHDEETYLRKYAQAQEMLADAEAERLIHPYIIVTGDFNMYGLSFDSANYIGVGKPYADAGYTLVNWNESVGFVKTYYGGTSATSLDDFSLSCDNIMVTPNIEIVSAVFDTTKLSYLDGNPIDHVPVIATLRIN